MVFSSAFLLLLLPVSAIFIIILFLAMAFEKTLEDRLRAIRSIYVYSVSFISLCVFLFGLGMLVYTGLSYSVFPKALDQNYAYRMNNCDYIMDIDAKNGTMTGTTMESNEARREKCIEEQKVQIADEKEARFQSDMLSGIIMVLIALPVYIVHFFFLRRKEG